jgi:wyosine [tRNA(Phe)-imidazoG37] synthetase (radical SAM superfamily)
METKEQLVQTLQQWKTLYSEIKVLNAEVVKRRNEKKSIEEKLKKTMNQNNIDNFDLNGGQLSYIKREIKKPLTQKSINEIIRKIEPNQDKADYLLQQIQDSREVVEVEKIQYRERK